MTLWRTTVERRPHGRARAALATELLSTGQHAEAIRLLRDAVTDFPDARAALGTELLVDRRTEEGMAVLRKFIADGPSLRNRIPAHVLLAQALTEQRELDQAAAEWRAVLALAPADAGARTSLANLLTVQAETALRRQDATNGERFAGEAVQLDSNNGTAQNLLGVALASKGNLKDALRHFQEAVRINPNDGQARTNLDRAMRASVSPSPSSPSSAGK